MSKLLTITTNPNYYSINSVTFTNSLVFRLTWSILDNFERTYSKQLKKIPKDFIRDLKELVETIVDKPGYYSLLEDFDNRFSNHLNLCDFRIPHTLYDFGKDARNTIIYMNQELASNRYEFTNISAYPKTMLVKTFLEELGLYERVNQDMVSNRVRLLMDDWETLQDRTKAEIEYYRSLNVFEKHSFLYGQAYLDTDNLVHMTLFEFHNCGHFNFLDPDLKYEFTPEGICKIDMSTFYALKD